MLNGECEVGWFGLLHAILFTIFVTSLVHHGGDMLLEWAGFSLGVVCQVLRTCS